MNGRNACFYHRRHYIFRRNFFPEHLEGHLGAFKAAVLKRTQSRHLVLTSEKTSEKEMTRYVACTQSEDASKEKGHKIP
jgi:hypothetical protein